MYRVSKRQKKDNVILEQIDTYLFAEMVKVENDKIKLSLENQKMFITENMTSFSDITTMFDDLKKLQEITIILINSTTKEEIEVMIEIEGGI